MPAALRLATPDDAPALLEIYAPFVRDTTVSLELEVPTLADFRARIESTLAHAPWLLCEDAGAVVGYAYATRFRPRAAYQWTVEVTVYVAPEHARRGVARGLYAALFAATERAGFTTAIAVISLPNAPSVALHERLGFVRAGHLVRAGFKLGAWVDVGLWQRDLSAVIRPHPAAPRLLPAGDEALARALREGAALVR